MSLSKEPEQRFSGARSESSDDSTVSKSELQTDGGWLAWSQVLVSHLLVVNGFGYQTSFGLFQSHWMDALKKSSSDISWVGSIQLFLLFFVGTISGRIMDAGYFRSLVYVGCSLQLLGIFTTSAVGKYWQLVLSQGITTGLGNGTLFTPAIALVSTYFVKKRPLALGFAACGAPVGGIVFPIIARQLDPQIGFRWTTRVMGFVMIFNAVIIVLLARPGRSNRPRGSFVEWGAFRELPYTLFAIGIFFTLWGVYFAYFYTMTFGKSIAHISDGTSLILLVVLNAVGIPGRLIPALLANAYFGAFNTLLVFVLCVGIMLYCWIAISSFGGFVAFVVVYGFCSNAVQTLFPSTLSSLTTDLNKMGVRVGMVFSIISIACLTGPPIAGVLIDKKHGDYLYAQIFGGTTVILGVSVLFAARLAQIRISKQSKTEATTG
ncbi:MFS monocarboxylate transporter-like protein [Xylona heveae TC161]|uniref:MFS monocarboxylate transporter-like protein n=1 Tax=Xylona heveae (strain CBS 132557 / TC161) TaxID=1328760 RepID=A0A165AAP3_XYLHT|nr:MFS monocarboxylate transporter-like protein [Xylona heveae TC161]KZF20181.1 MFS monocarboxylate transporter-like protein [Xylona heveae TC161]